MPSRAESLERLLASRPGDSRLLFGLALEYLREDRLEEGVDTLQRYLAVSDDQGNAWARLAGALRRLGREAEARQALERGIEAAERHGHPSMAQEMRDSLG
jgi:predicted Zn-dependent protease